MGPRQHATATKFTGDCCRFVSTPATKIPLQKCVAGGYELYIQHETVLPLKTMPQKSMSGYLHQKKP